MVLTSERHIREGARVFVDGESPARVEAVSEDGLALVWVGESVVWLPLSSLHRLPERMTRRAPGAEETR